LTRLGDATGRPIAVVSDALNHASIIDGTRLARVPVSVYPHNDVEAARAAIVEHGAAGRRSVIVTDSVFSMDGDVAPLFELAELAQATGALLVVDDAHAVFAGHGADALASSDAEILIVGTLSKALGSQGGFVAGPRSLVDWCRNTARSFIFSTASPPSVVAAALAALAVVRSDEGRALTAALRANVDALLPGHVSAVVPVVLGEERRALDVSAALLDRGLLVPAIRPPTVAVGASRLRIAVSAAHTPADVAELIEALGALGVTLDAEVAA
jgi:7-keto-8-aminopelargonate synthetase-like enzyme